jgi:hypothetical protein
MDGKRQSSERNSKRDTDLYRSADSQRESSRGSSRRHPSEMEERTKKIGSHVTDSDGEDDDEVNEDIMAFYKAKEELLKRRGG